VDPVTRLSRRWFVGGLAASVASLTLFGGCGLDNLVTSPTQRVHRIGALLPTNPSLHPEAWDAFVDELRARGWVEGQNLTIEWRAADNQVDQLPGLAADLVRLPVELIVTDGSQVSVIAKQATSTIPIVFYSGDPIGVGLVASLAQPGGNVTGWSARAPIAKAIELFKQVVPGLSHLAVLRDTTNPASTGAPFADLQEAARALRLDMLDLDMRTSEDVTGAFASAIAWGADGLVVMPSPATESAETRIAELAARNRLPATYAVRHYVEAGGLMSCGVNQVAGFRLVASYVDKILRGARPGDLPVELSKTFDFIVNVRAAQALGLSIPPDVAVQVTEWFQ
jgi:putative ABC transport system substrate-binding protein